MPIINLRKYYYPTYKTDTFIEVSDEVAEALLLMLRAENNYERKRRMRKIRSFPCRYKAHSK